MDKTVKVPCQRCGKLLSEAISSPLSGLWICDNCALKDPKMVARLDDKTRVRLGLKPFKGGYND